jgi:hypothetical protein
VNSDERRGLPPVRLTFAMTTEDVIGRARSGSVRDAKALLSDVADALRQGLPLDGAAAAFVADALDVAVCDYKKVAKALCLVPGKGAPKRTGIARIAGYHVLALQGDGMPVEDGAATRTWDGIGALSIVADSWRQECGIELSRDQLKRGLAAATRQQERRKHAKAQAKSLAERTRNCDTQ